MSFVDAQTGLLWLNGPQGQTVKIAAPTKLLNRLQTGDKVNLVVTQQSTAMEGVSERDTASAVVQKVDPTSGLLRLMTEQGEIVDLQPFQKLAQDLQAGDRVTVAIYSVNETGQATQSGQRQTS